MKFIFIIYILCSILMADSRYCSSTNNKQDKSIVFSREYYNIGDIISNEDQFFPFSVCHSDGEYDVGSIFRLSDYSSEIILISMNATW